MKIQKKYTVSFTHNGSGYGYNGEDDFEDSAVINTKQDLAKFVKRVLKRLLYRSEYNRAKYYTIKSFDFYSYRFIIIDGEKFVSTEQEDTLPPAYAEDTINGITAVFVRAFTLFKSVEEIKYKRKKMESELRTLEQLKAKYGQ